MKKKLILIPLLVLALLASVGVVAPVSAAGIPTIDGVIEDGEWGTPLCTTVGYTHGILSVTVYAHATMDTLYLAFDTNDMTDERGGRGLDVLDWNIGLVGDEVKLPWRYVLVTKIYPDASWGDQWDAIDNGYYGSWADTWITGYYSHIPAGIEMVTSFATGHRVTEFKIPMSIMFDGEHGWDGPYGGETLLLGGTFSGETFLGEDSQVIFDMLWWPQGINHGVAETYATYKLPPAPTAPERDPAKFDVFVRLGYDSTRYNSDGALVGSIEAAGEYNDSQYMLKIPEGCEITGAAGRVNWLWLPSIDGDILSFVGGRGNVEFSKPCTLYTAEGGKIYQDRWTGEWTGGSWVKVGTFKSIVDGEAHLK